MLSLVGAIFLAFGVFIYSAWLKDYETRTLIRLVLIIMAISSFFNVALTLQWNEALGISNFTFLFFTSSTLFPLILGLFIIPPFVLIAKISPMHVEATIFAFSGSLIAGSLSFLSRLIGVFWNSVLFKVSADNLSELYKLYVMEIGASLLCLCYVRLIPTWEEVREV